MGTVAEAVAADPANATAVIDAFNDSWADLEGVISRQGMSPEVAARFLGRVK